MTNNVALEEEKIRDLEKKNIKAMVEVAMDFDLAT